MELKDRVLEILEQNRGKAVSGAALAEVLGVSRTAVWKCVEALRSQGADITAATNRGYMLAVDSDILSAEGIIPLLKENRYSITVTRSVTSTNTVLKDLAQGGAPENTVIIAETQTAGKGRMGRRFESPSESGLYMSVLLRPKAKASESLFITAAAAVAVCRAAEELNGKPESTSIKWVNDVFLNGKKICGILTEAALDLESGGLEYAVLGIGVNVYPSKAIKSKLADIAAPLLTKPAANSRNKLAAGILNELTGCLAPENRQLVINEYRSRSYLDGRNVTVVRGNERYPAKVIEIDENGRLKVITGSGEVRLLTSGEVSITNIQ